jgi:hypothetical protein
LFFALPELVAGMGSAFPLKDYLGSLFEFGSVADLRRAKAAGLLNEARVVEGLFLELNSPHSSRLESHVNWALQNFTFSRESSRLLSRATWLPLDTGVNLPELICGLDLDCEGYESLLKQDVLLAMGGFLDDLNRVLWVQALPADKQRQPLLCAYKEGAAFALADVYRRAPPPRERTGGPTLTFRRTTPSPGEEQRAAGQPYLDLAEEVLHKLAKIIDRFAKLWAGALLSERTPRRGLLGAKRPKTRCMISFRLRTCCGPTQQAERAPARGGLWPRIG